MKLNPTLLALAAFAAMVGQANAIVVVGTTAGGALWNRPVAGNPPTPPASGVGTAVPYTVLPFTVSSAGTYVFQSTATAPANWDNYAFLYQTAFSAAAPFTNVLIGSDDNPSIGLAGFSYALTTGTNYYFITTGFANTDFGAYSNSITGPGSVNVVPEPETYGLMLLGLAGVAAAVRRKSASTTA